MSLFLTKEEVAQLTGKLRPSAQIRELKARGIAHTVNARREPVVTCEAVRLYHHLTAGAPLSSGTPWFVEGQTVHEWLRVRRSEFLLSLE